MSDDRKISELPTAGNLNLEDLLAVVHEGTTSRVTLGELIKELRMEIPQPRIKIRRDVDNSHHGHDQVFAFWEGSDGRFTKYNPEFWLYRYKKAGMRSFVDKESGNRRKEWRHKRFVHPSHVHGSKPEYAGKRLYAGAQQVLLDGFADPQPIPSRNTEWDCSNNPMAETELNLAPWTYFRIKDMANPALGIDPDDFPMTQQLSPRGTGSSKSRFVVCKVRIAIDNPDTDSEYPKIFGPFSETFILYPFKSGNEFKSLKYFLGAEAAPQLRKKPSS